MVDTGLPPHHQTTPLLEPADLFGPEDGYVVRATLLLKQADPIGILTSALGVAAITAAAILAGWA